METNNKNSNPNDFPLPDSQYEYQEQGMTLRDYFAAKAMQGLLSSYVGSSNCSDDMMNKSERIAYRAYKTADAMLEQRNLNQQ